MNHKTQATKSLVELEPQASLNRTLELIQSEINPVVHHRCVVVFDTTLAPDDAEGNLDIMETRHKHSILLVQILK